MSAILDDVPQGILVAFVVTFVVDMVLFVVWRCMHNGEEEEEIALASSELAKYDKTSHKYDAVATLKKSASRDFKIPYANLRFKRILGKGAQGEVFMAEWQGLDVAVKRVNTNEVDEDIIEELCQEAEIMKGLRHPNITLFMGLSLEKPNLCMVTELVSRGSLFDIIHDTSDQNFITWRQSLNVMTDVARGMVYLHSHKPPILHRDLKSLNILVSDKWGGKVADFGMSRVEDNDGATMTQCGSPLWMCPEMIQDEKYDGKADVYSFGICLWEIYTKRIPYRDLELTPNQLVVKVVKDRLRPDIPLSCPPMFASLMRRCWHWQPHKRPTFELILQVMEKMLSDPAVVNHKPGSEKQMAGAVDEMDEDEETSVLDVSVGTEAAWLIQDPSTVKLEGRLTQTRGESKHSSRHAAQHPLTGLAQAQYREKKVVVQLIPVSFSENSSRDGFSETEILQMVREDGVINLRHPNLVLFMGCFIKKADDALTTKSGLTASRRNGKQKVTLGLVFENMHRGTLEDILEDEKILFNWDTTLHMLMDACQGMAFLTGTTNPFVHPDLSPQNLLVDKQWRVKLTNYTPLLGTRNLTKIGGRTRRMSHAMALSPWTPPEQLADLSSPPSVEGNVYSFGLIIWGAITRKIPFENRTQDGRLHREIIDGLRPEIPESLSPEFRQLIERCWHKNPSKRPSFAAIVDQLRELRKLGPRRLTLSAENAQYYRKAQTVLAFRSKDPMTVYKQWGKNVGGAHSMLVFGGTGDVYMMDSQVFERTYEPTLAHAVPHSSLKEYEGVISAKHWGDCRFREYRKVGKVLARLMAEPFAIKTKAGTEQGNAGDYLVQNSHGEQWTVDATEFQRIYTRLEEVVVVVDT